MPQILQKRRNLQFSEIKLKDLIYIRYCKKWNDIQLALAGNNDKFKWSQAGFVPKQLEGFLF